MILDKCVKLKITDKNISRAKIYQNGSKIGYEIDISVDKLFLSENVKINVKCDICEKELIINYVNYNLNLRKNNNIFGCSKCNRTKNIKQTCFKKYGVENVSFIDSVVEKRKQTELKNWGGHHMKNDIFIKEYMKNNIEKYGYSMPFNSIEILNKCSETVKNKYGVDNVFESNEIKHKIKETMLRIYGTEHPLGCEKIREKFVETMIEKYGVDNPSKYEEFKEKVKNTKIKNGYTFNESEWHSYRKKVRCITNKYKKTLFESWNGFDYYDNQYIKENFILKYTNINYPTIDHKISIIDGYKLSIEPEEIGGIDNLCYTKRTINSSKNYMSEIEFLKKLIL